MTPNTHTVDPAVRSWLMTLSEIDHYELDEFLTEDSEQPFHLLINKELYDHRSRPKIHQILNRFHGAPVYNDLTTRKGAYEVFIFPNSSLCWQARLTIGDEWTYHGFAPPDEETVAVNNTASVQVRATPAKNSKLHQILKQIRKK